ncbi:MAG TPA: hypothetical protein VMW51_01575 [Terriglobia bacterium]|nr:hypothetical protein [Terriglobia bacterium]
MISGFNTEIVVDGTLFHIQTEPRKGAGIETAVYVQGGVVHSLTTLHPGLSSTPPGDQREFTRLLEEQHRQVIEQIRAGKIKPLSSPETGPVPPVTS